MPTHDRPSGPPAESGGPMKVSSAAPSIAAATPRPKDDAIASLYRTHAVELIRLALLLLGDQHTAEDVVQDAFLGLHAGIGRLRAPGKALPYLRASVVNGCRSVQRRRGRVVLTGIDPEPAPVWSAES